MAQIYGSEAYANGMSGNQVDDGQTLKSFNVDGVYSETYQDNSSKSLNSTVQGVYNSLYPLTKSGYASSPCGGGSGGVYRENMFPCSGRGFI